MDFLRGKYLKKEDLINDVKNITNKKIFLCTGKDKYIYCFSISLNEELSFEDMKSLHSKGYDNFERIN